MMNKSIKMVVLILVAIVCGYIAGNNISRVGTSLTNSPNKGVSNVDISYGLKFLNEVNKFFADIDINEDVDVLKVQIATKLYELANGKYNSTAVDSLVLKLLGMLGNVFEDGNSLFNYFKGELTKAIADVGSSLDSLVLTPDKQVSITSTTAALSTEAGSDYKVKLNAYIYYADVESTKWVVLVHGYMMNGKLITNSLGEMYLAKGYNVLAPDLRGFGKSGGSVAMGYLESLDIWDWLTYINNSNSIGIGNRAATEVIVHGISLGGATTLQLWTQVGFGRDLATQNVIGLVDDCGYDSMTGIIEGMLTTGAGMELLSSLTQLVDKEDLYDLIGEENIKNLLLNVLKVGIKENEFDLKQNPLHKDRIMSDVPLYIIHGTADTTVPYSISTSIVYPKAVQANLLYNFWQVSGKPHAFIVVGMEKTNYQNRLYKFIDYVEKREPQEVVIPNEDIVIESDNTSLKSLINSIISLFQTIKKLLKI